LIHVATLRHPPAKHADVLPQDKFSGSSFALDLLSEAAKNHLSDQSSDCELNPRPFHARTSNCPPTQPQITLDHGSPPYQPLFQLHFPVFLLNW
jgi:hypothetical protein